MCEQCCIFLNSAAAHILKGSLLAYFYQPPGFFFCMPLNNGVLLMVQMFLTRMLDLHLVSWAMASPGAFDEDDKDDTDDKDDANDKDDADDDNSDPSPDVP